jgi:hypothetical protein
MGILESIYPGRLAARQIIRKVLRLNRIDPSVISRSCLDELAEAAIALAKFNAPKKSDWKMYLLEPAKYAGYAVAQLLYGDGMGAISELKKASVHPMGWEILKKHHPDIFGLDSLGVIQAKYSALKPRFLRSE